MIDTGLAQLFHLFCDRCGKQFDSATADLECAACIYATRPNTAVLGYAQRTPLIKKLVTT